MLVYGAEFETPDPSLKIQAFLWTIGTGVRLMLYGSSHDWRPERDWTTA